ncbi:MAG: clan AA aspartic protease [Planctomycetota bacterium]|nr:clan AA aspartic protease [Planctomycetota bacterium]
MKGIVDDDLRALLEVHVGGVANGAKSSVLVWVDTAFNGGLVLPRHEIDRLGLKEYSSTPAILADGQEVELPTYTCYLDWFGKEYRTQIVANPLLGTMLLDGHDLAISYRRRSLTLD